MHRDVKKLYGENWHIVLKAFHSNDRMLKSSKALALHVTELEGDTATGENYMKTTWISYIDICP